MNNNQKCIPSSTFTPTCFIKFNIHNKQKNSIGFFYQQQCMQKEKSLRFFIFEESLISSDRKNMIYNNNSLIKEIITTFLFSPLLSIIYIFDIHHFVVFFLPLAGRRMIDLSSSSTYLIRSLPPLDCPKVRWIVLSSCVSKMMIACRNAENN